MRKKLPLAAVLRRCRRRQAEAPRHRGHEPVERRAGLGAARQVDPAQEGRALVAGLAEHRLDEALDVGLERRDLGGEAEDGGAPVEVVLRRHAAGRPRVQPLDEAADLGPDRLADRLGGDGAALLPAGPGQGGAPDLLATACVEVGEEVGEAGQQVGLGEQQVDRQPARPAAARARAAGRAPPRRGRSRPAPIRRCPAR